MHAGAQCQATSRPNGQGKMALHPVPNTHSPEVRLILPSCRPHRPDQSSLIYAGPHRFVFARSRVYPAGTHFVKWRDRYAIRSSLVVTVDQLGNVLFRMRQQAQPADSALPLPECPASHPEALPPSSVPHLSYLLVLDWTWLNIPFNRKRRKPVPLAIASPPAAPPYALLEVG